MIYVSSDNFYLCEGIKETIYPLQITNISTQADLVRASNLIGELDVLVIDSNYNCNYSLICNARKERTKIVVLISSKRQKENFISTDSCFYILNARVSMSDFKTYLLSAMTGRVDSSQFSSRLTRRERFVLKESLKGLTVKEIASINSLPEKSVYAQRLMACRKLGFNSHRAIWGIPISTVEWQL